METDFFQILIAPFHNYIAMQAKGFSDGGLASQNNLDLAIFSYFRYDVYQLIVQSLQLK